MYTSSGTIQIESDNTTARLAARGAHMADAHRYSHDSLLPKLTSELPDPVRAPTSNAIEAEEANSTPFTEEEAKP